MFSVCLVEAIRVRVFTGAAKCWGMVGAEKKVFGGEWKVKYVQGQSRIRLVGICQVWNSAHNSK